MLEAQLAQARTPEVEHLKKLLRKQRDEAFQVGRKAARLQEEQGRLDKDWGDLASAMDDAKDRTAAASPLTDDERAALAATPFTAPADVAGVAASLTVAIGNLREHIERHKGDREKLDVAALGHIAAYRNLDERTARETDGTIESLPALLAIYQRLVTDDLPRAKNAWLAKVDEDMNRQLRGRSRADR